MRTSSALSTLVPAEVLVGIFQYCESLADLRALFLTCRHLRSVWESNIPAIAWHVGPKVIPAFEQAFRAVRAIAPVHEAHRGGHMPPEIAVREISASAGSLSLLDLRDISDLHHLAQCIEVRYCNVRLPEDYAWGTSDYERWPLDRAPPPPLNTPEEPQDMSVWRERLHAAVYTALLFGAVFARAYHQPFHPYPVFHASSSSSDKTADRCRQRLFDLLRKPKRGRLSYSYLGIDDKEEELCEYLRTFPVFDLNDELGAQKNIFGPFIDWFVEEAILQHQANPPTSSRDMLRDEVRAATLEAFTGMDPSPPGGAWVDWPEVGLMSQWFTGGSTAEGEAILWLTMQAIHMFEFILGCVVNSDGKPRLGRPLVSNPTPLSRKPRVAKVVLFGVFQAECISMPETIEDSANQPLLAHTPFSSNPYLMATPPVLDIPLVLEDLYLRSSIPNLDPRYPVAPPPLQFFTFLLRDRFNLKFHTKMFSTSRAGVQDYHFFKNRATIFANGPEQVPDREWFDYTNGTEFLAEYKAPQLRRSDPRFVEEINPRAWDIGHTSPYY